MSVGRLAVGDQLPRGVAYRWRPCPFSLSATDHHGLLGACWSALALSLGTRPPSDLDYDLRSLPISFDGYEGGWEI
jgi:hypothetical protein